MNGVPLNPGTDWTVDGFCGAVEIIHVTTAITDPYNFHAGYDFTDESGS